MNTIHINRHTITRALLLYIFSYFGVILFMFSIKDHLGENIQTAALYTFFATFYLPLNVFLMFLMETSPSITIPGLLSGLVCGHILLGKVDFSFDMRD